MSKTGLLTDNSLTHAGLRSLAHPRLGSTVASRTAVRYFRFGGPVRLDRLELGRNVYGRWIPSVPCHPAHLIISKLNRDDMRWQIVREVDLPEDPAIAGRGLSQSTDMAKLEEHFKKILRRTPRVINLGGIECDHLRVECDREHPVWPNHGECNGGPFNVPFGILEPLTAHGQPVLRKQINRAPYRPILELGDIRPKAPRGMQLRQLPHEIRFQGRRFSIGFSTRRAVLTHLGWDYFGQVEAHINRLLFYGYTFAMSGPVLRTLEFDLWSRLWSGRIDVRGNRVSYRDLQCHPSLRIDATFVVEPDGLILELTQHCRSSMVALEAEAWRFAWDLSAGQTAVVAVPTLASGRAGDVRFPLIFATDGAGCLSCQPVSAGSNPSDDVRFQVETYRQPRMSYPRPAMLSGFVLGTRPPEADAALTLRRGTHQAVFDLRLCNFQPDSTGGRSPGRGIDRHWATTFACFRSEYRGFSNNAASTNCLMSQGPPIEVASRTKKPRVGPDPLDLCRFSIEQSILDGGGYGYHRNLYLDSDPVLVSAAGRIHQIRPDRAWLKRIEPGLREAVQRMLAIIGRDGLAVCRDLTGNSASHRWSSNGMDVVGFGHIDAYVNAWTYRALRCAAAMLFDLGDSTISRQCAGIADAMPSAFSRLLINPRTGWVAGWRSRDGKLHDYAFTWVNGVACAFGLLDHARACRAMTRLERLRDRIGPRSAVLGLPCNLLPIDPSDHMLARILGQGQPTFELYTDGALSGYCATYYLRALSIHGPRGAAVKLARELDQGYAEGCFSGGIGAGSEFRSWEGLPTGYEGTLGVCFGPLYAIAIEQKVFKPLKPEWWPQTRGMARASGSGNPRAITESRRGGKKSLHNDCIYYY